MSAEEPLEEQVRPCLGCGELLPFASADCPACGRRADAPGVTEEAVKPCLQCGELIPFDATTCPRCGDDREPEEEEAVKPCLLCGNILPFHAEACSLCGTRCRGDSDGEQAVKPCLACEALIPADDFFCPQCGDFALSMSVAAGSGSVAPIGSQEGRAVTFLAHLVSFALFGLALALVAAVALEYWRVRTLGNI